jgi:hypothetical protein
MLPVQGVNGHWRSLDPSLVARLAGDQLMRLVSALHMLVEVLNRWVRRVASQRGSAGKLSSSPLVPEACNAVTACFTENGYGAIQHLFTSDP